MTSVAATLPAPLTSSGPTPLSLQIGQIISGVVIGLLNDTTLRLQTPSGLLDVTTNTSLPPGTPVEMSVQGTPAHPELTVTPVETSAGQPIGPDVEGATNATSLRPNVGTAPDNMARSATAASSNQSEISQPPRIASPVMQAALASASVIFRDAAASQGGLATLYANLEALVAEATPGTPRPVLFAANRLLALRLDTGSTDAIDAGVIKSALLRAGLAAQTTETLASETGSGDVSTALTVLRQALKNWLDIEPSAKAASPRQNAATTPAVRATAPMPPYRGAPTVPQAPEAASITATSPREQASQLLTQTNAAIARQTLLGIASLPEQQTSATAHGETASARLMFDIPIATAQGTGVAQLTIERDRGNRRGGQNADPVWRTDFSIDLEPIGPVHVHIALAGARATVTMKAERPKSAAVLTAGLPLLEAGLRGAALEPGELRCHEGSPRSGTVMPGAFLDQAT